MEKLQQKLDELLSHLKEEKDVRGRLATLLSVYPFNRFEYLISILLGRGVLSLDAYYEIRDEYIARNLYLYIFEIGGPRTFGEAWAQGHLKELVPDLVKPCKKLDPKYSGEYDFFLDGKMRIEVKASRAVDFDTNEPLYVKALSSDSQKPFDMNFQQVKCGCCDVFVWIGVWRDVIRHWVLSSSEVESNPYFSRGQHRGNIGEGQLHLNQDNISEFAKYEAKGSDLLEAMRAAHSRQASAKPAKKGIT
jgi:hypothetical protein